MYEKDFTEKGTIQIQEVVHSNPQSTQTEKEEKVQTAPSPPPPRVLTSIKRWSENKQRYFYKPKDPDYAKNHYWKTKHDMQCTICGAIVTTAMHRHLKSLRCVLVRDAVKKAIGQTHIEGEEPSHQIKT